VDIEVIMERPCWVIDILPKRVPESSDGQYFKVEQYYLAESHITALREKFLEIILKLSCYYAVDISTDCGDSWLDAPTPEIIEKNIMKCVGANSLYIRTSSPECLITIDGCDTYMTVYDPDDELIDTLKQLSSAVGLFMWQA
jgi:hypothetical protein